MLDSMIHTATKWVQLFAMFTEHCSADLPSQHLTSYLCLLYADWTNRGPVANEVGHSPLCVISVARLGSHGYHLLHLVRNFFASQNITLNSK